MIRIHPAVFVVLLCRPLLNITMKYHMFTVDVVDAFFTHLQLEQIKINEILSKNEPMKPLTVDQNTKYDKCENCPSCNIALTPENKVRHHCHVTGDFLSALCNNCNLQMKFVKRTKGRDDKNYLIPVIFHNLRGYDSHVILKHLSRFFAPNDVFVIANNMEKYLAFEIDGLRFLDSLQFLNCSLDTLVQNLSKEVTLSKDENSSKEGNSKFVHMRRLYPNDEQFKLLLRKGVYPYEYMNNAEKMSETCLPPQEKFFSRLTDEGISDADYAHAQKVWEAFSMCTMRHYHDRYLESDVVLLADVFEAFRKMCLIYYQLDPLHYYSSPGLSWDACMKMTNESLDPIHIFSLRKGCGEG